jgi:hypothetical protein
MWRSIPALEQGAETAHVTVEAWKIGVCGPGSQQTCQELFSLEGAQTE